MPVNFLTSADLVGRASSTRVLLTLWLLMMVAVIGLPPVPGSGIVWDGLNGMGLAALLLLLLGCWQAPSRYASYNVYALRVHIGLSTLVVVAVAIHAFGLLIANDVAIEYLKWRAPAYMHAGNIGFVLLIVLSICSLSRLRRRLHANFEQFRVMHRGLSVAALMLAGWHIIGSGFLTAASHGVATMWTEDWNPPLSLWWRGWLVAVLLLLTTTLWWRYPHRHRSTTQKPYEGASSAIRGALVWQLLLLIMLTAGYVTALQWTSLSTSPTGDQADNRG